MKKKLFQTAAIFSVAALLTELTAAQPAAANRPAGDGDSYPHSHVRQDGAQPAATTGPAGLVPTQIRQAYGFDQLYNSVDGTGQTIAIIDAFGDRYTTTSGSGKKTTTTITDATQSDWTKFCGQFGLPTGGLTVVYPQGTNSVDTGWAMETALDIQWAHAIAPGAKILLVVSYDNSFSNMFAAVDYAVTTGGANVVSMSWGGGGGAGELTYDAHFKYPGVTFVASSGDGGEGAMYPAVSPYVVSVGGTTLTIITNVDGTYSYGSEAAWSGSGGGISAYEPMPSFQNGWQQFDTGGMRSVPDVSYLGGPGSSVSVYSAANGGWVSVYGTSVGAPQWAALFALANAAGYHSGTPGGANSILYSIAAGSTTPPYTTINPYLIDITSGSNDGDPDDYGTSGYDFVTGLGSPRANYLVPALASLPISSDFLISATPASSFVPVLALDGAGSWSVSWNDTYEVKVNRFGGFSDPVDLSVSLSPSDLTAALTRLGNDSYVLSVAGSQGSSAKTYSLTFTGTDTASGTALAGSTRTAAATLVADATPSAAYVVRPLGTQGWSVVSGKTLQVQVMLRDNFGQPVPGATVYVMFYLNGTAYRTAGATTDSTGTATFTAVFNSHGVPPGTYSIRVTSVSAAGLTWDGTTPANSYTQQ
jgi:hypothetical protein